MPALAVDAAVELLLVAAFLVLFGMLVAYKYSLSPVLLTIAHLFQKVSIPLPFHHVHPLRFAAKAIIDVDRSVLHWLAVGVNASEGGIVRVFHATGNMIGWLGRELGDLSWELYTHAVHLEHVVLPHLLRDAERLARRLTAAVRHELAVVEHHLLARIESKIAATWRHIAAVELRLAHAVELALARAEHYADAGVLRAYHYADALEHRLALGIDRVRADLTHQLYHGIDELRAWVDARLSPIRRELDDLAAAIPKVEGGLGALSKEVQGLEGLFAVGAFATAVAAALEALGMGFLKCRNVGKVGRALCGLENGLVDFLLGATADALLVTHLCELIHLESEVFAQFEPVLTGFVEATDALVGCNGATAAPPLSLTYSNLPAPRGALSLA